MLTLKLGEKELYSDEKQEFIKLEPMVLELEHSLHAMALWESIWEKPFLGPNEKTTEETYSYIQCMSIQDVELEDLHRLTNEDFEKINTYIAAKRTATWFTNDGKKGPPSREIITSEIIYYWMTSMSVDKECEHWHLNRLFTLMRVIEQKNKPEKKMSKRDLMNRNRALNAERKARLGTSG